MIQITGIKIQITSILANPKSCMDIEKNKRNASINNPSINRMVAIMINLDSIFFTSTLQFCNISFFKNISLEQKH